MRPAICFIMFLALFCSCSKPKTKEGPSFVKEMCGVHSFHRISSGYNPYTNTHFSDTADVTINIVYKDALTVAIDTSLYQFASKDSTGVATYESIRNNYTSYGSIIFDHRANAVRIYQSTHISAAAGNWDTNFYSY